jgi:hypothetical protein
MVLGLGCGNLFATVLAWCCTFAATVCCWLCWQALRRHGLFARGTWSSPMCGLPVRDGAIEALGVANAWANIAATSRRRWSRWMPQISTL